MTFQEAIDYLYSRLPVFQDQGARAYKPGLTTTRELCEHLSDPQLRYKTIHVGGTNGKGSTSHMLASILQKAGYKVGLYTSPHLKSFTERIRINGVEIDKNYIANFVSTHREYIESLQPSFFEATVGMAFSYFADQYIDVAVVEVGMGGRLDSTNIITPELSIITNISYDHMQYLGNTLPKIAFEKAGIIKPGIPVIVNEYQGEQVEDVFKKSAEVNDSDLVFGYNNVTIPLYKASNYTLHFEAKTNGEVETKKYELDLVGDYQLKNVKGVLMAVELLRIKGFKIAYEDVFEGLRSVKKTTGLKGRWQILSETPFVVCDTAHNEAGLAITIDQFTKVEAQTHRFVLGFVNDKDVESILHLFPKDGAYYFCQPSNQRALSATHLTQKAENQGIKGSCYDNVNDALNAALKDSGKKDAIYVGGSTFVVSDIDQL
jgi:dihydrofolate synthase/folylpolyglutamate synthase